MLNLLTKAIFLLTSTLLLAGCAVGNKYNYRTAEIALPLKGSGAIGLKVDDQRPYVLSGDKNPNFVGLQRSGAGIPYNVTTQSGGAFEADVYIVLANGLQKSGYTVMTIEKNAASGEPEKTVFLRIEEWKTDIYLAITLHYDLILQILDDTGAVLAESRLSSIEEIGGYGFGSKNSDSAANALATKIAYLFNTPSIKAALSP